MKRFLTYIFISAFLATGAEAAAGGLRNLNYSPKASKDSSMAETKITALPSSLSYILEKADSLRLNYAFVEAIELLDSAVKFVSDSSLKTEIDASMILAQNARNMLDYCSYPIVLAKQKFSIHDFFLFYPLPDKSWRPLPNKLDSLSAGGFPKAMYIPENASAIYYSAKDEDRIRNVYKTELQKEIWSAPKLLNEGLTSSSDEIFPMLSEDGRSLYFASRGLYGVGGYDIYVSQWDEELKDWGVPVNLGFPYSSPYDDFLFMNTPDGKYSIFASNRETTPDSVFVYVMEFDRMPVRKAVSDREELLKLMSLNPVNDPARLDNDAAVAGKISENPEMRRYNDKMNFVRLLRNRVKSKENSIDESRAKLSGASEQEREGLAGLILEREAELQDLQDSLAAAVKDLQRIEMEFLSNGVLFEPLKIQEEADREVVGVSSGYTFSRNTMGPPFEMELMKPTPKFDYSFMILNEGRYAENNTLPSGLVYQIQLFNLASKAEIRQLRGLSPVFWRQDASSRYTHYAGVFRKYEDVLANLNRVKKAGFKAAFIVAFQDGEPVSLKKAKELENKVKDLYQIRINTEDNKLLSSSDISLIQAITNGDLLKSEKNGLLSYIIGPYQGKKEAETILESLRSLGLSKIEIEKLEN